MSPRLLALDLDGTLLRTDGAIDPRDAAAIRRALDAGVTVTIATGRVSTGALPVARALGLEAPLVCADGGVLVCSRSGERLEQQAIALEIAHAAVGTLDAHALAPFVLTHDAVHGDESGRAYHPFLSIWTTELTVHPRLTEAQGWRREGEIAFTVGVGEREQVEAALAALDREHAAHLSCTSFRALRAEERWAVLARPRGCSKGAALARLAARLGVAREDAAVVGDWFNDLSMFEWAGRSFAMGRSPEAVRASATDTLDAEAGCGGGAAEAIAKWL
jgi:Cof subfamily protein (haloacid dehalogenase superfamily)